jgi:ketosteroid isomerase-like protein
MSAQEHVQLVQAGYMAFGSGDIPAILELLTDDVEWVIPGPTDLPWKGTRRGKAAVSEWFPLLGQNIEFRIFEPHSIIAQDNQVVCLLHIESVMRRTQQPLTYEEAQIWTFRNGKVARFQIFEDTAAVAAAYRGQELEQQL